MKDHDDFTDTLVLVAIALTVIGLIGVASYESSRPCVRWADGMEFSGTQYSQTCIPKRICVERE